MINVLQKLKKIFPYLIILGVGFVCYWGALKNPFIWDDEETVVSNQFIRKWSNLPKIFTYSLFGEKFSGASFYRPIQTASYFIDYAFWKLNPAGYHLTNLLIHILNTFLVFLIFRKLPVLNEFKITKAFFISLIFLIHPVQTESVVYVSGRGDLLA
ncbi:MAG: hypothetical protein ACK4JE_03055, partial [Endomicrobiia bacterium]